MSQIDLKSLLSLTFRRPADAARLLIALDLPMGLRWGSVVLVSAVAGIMAYVMGQMVGAAQEGAQSLYGQIADSPLILAGLQLVAMVFAAGVMAFVGGFLGGKGRFEDALVLAAWIEAVLMLVQALQMVLLFVLPGFAAMMGLAAVVLSFYLMVQFTKGLHDLQSGWKVAVAIIGTVFVLGFVLSFIAAAFGLFPEASA